MKGLGLRGWWSGRRGATTLLLGLGALAVLLVLGMSLGAVRIGPGELWDALSQEGTLAHQVIWDIRLPRLLAAALVGASLAVSGALLQAVTRNSLADPHLLGISAGAALASAIMLVRGVALPPPAAMAVAVAGGLLGAGGIYLAAWQGATSPVRITLAGVGISSLFLALTLAVLATSRLFAFASLTFIGGSLFGRGWDDVNAAWPFAVAGLGLSWLMAQPLNILILGDDVAAELGLKVERTRWAGLALAAVLGGTAVKVAGLVGFVGLVIPHVARFLVGQDYRQVLPASALVGAAFIMACDIVARNVIAPAEVPMGVVSAAVGVPFFLYLLRRAR